MRKRWMLASVAVTVTMLMALGPTAMASKQHFWVGHVDKSHIVLFTTEKIGGVVYFEPIEIDFTLTCHVSGDEVDYGYSFFGFQEPVNKKGHFDLNLGDPYYGPFDWEGTLSGKTASGTVLAGFPLYDGQGGYGTQSCDNDPGADWTAKDLGSARPTSPHHSVQIRFTKDKHGQVHVAVTR